MEEIFWFEDNGYLLPQKHISKKHLCNSKILIYVIRIPRSKAENVSSGGIPPQPSLDPRMNIYYLMFMCIYTSRFWCNCWYTFIIKSWFFIALFYRYLASVHSVRLRWRNAQCVGNPSRALWKSLSDPKLTFCYMFIQEAMCHLFHENKHNGIGIHIRNSAAKPKMCQIKR